MVCGAKVRRCPPARDLIWNASLEDCPNQHDHLDAGELTQSTSLPMSTTSEKLLVTTANRASRHHDTYVYCCCTRTARLWHWQMEARMLSPARPNYLHSRQFNGHRDYAPTVPDSPPIVNTILAPVEALALCRSLGPMQVQEGLLTRMLGMESRLFDAHYVGTPALRNPEHEEAVTLLISHTSLCLGSRAI